MTPHKVLLVEDEYLVRELIKRIINGYGEDFEIIGEASSAVEALDSLDEDVPDIIVTDINMPIIDGITMSSRVRSLYPDIKIVIVSGHDDFNYAQRAIKLGVSDYILKPINEDNLMRSLFNVRKKLCKETRQPIPEQGHSPAASSELMRKIEKYIHDNLASDELSLAGTAKEFCFNASYLSRVFKQRAGISFREYINKARIAKAHEHLSEPDTKAYEIGSMVGIKDPNYFSTLFKKYTGTTITQYRADNHISGRN